MAEKRFRVFSTRVSEMTAIVYAESKEEAKLIAQERSDVEWECDNEDETINEILEEKNNE